MCKLLQEKVRFRALFLDLRMSVSDHSRISRLNFLGLWYVWFWTCGRWQQRIHYWFGNDGYDFQFRIFIRLFHILSDLNIKHCFVSSLFSSFAGYVEYTSFAYDEHVSVVQHFACTMQFFATVSTFDIGWCVMTNNDE